MRKVLLALAVLLLATTPAANQAIDFTTLVANQSGNFTWVSSAPSSSNRLITYSDYKTYVANTTTGCTVSNTAQIMTWDDVISCASVHTPTLQSGGVAASYNAGIYSTTYNPAVHAFSCGSLTGNTGYSGTPIVLPAGMVSPGASNPTAISLTSVTVASGVTAYVTLYNPAGTAVTGPFAISGSTYSQSYSGGGAAGSWTWEITYSGGTAPRCITVSGPSGGGQYFSASGSVSWYQ